MTDVITVPAGHYLRLRRQAWGMSIAEAAALIDVSDSTWGSWERGDRHPSADRWLQALQALGCRLEARFDV